jgi:thiamine-phosphate pyrophosphorylase
MKPRYPAPPGIWLFTDERMGEALWRALERMPRGAAIVFRHYSLQRTERCALFARVRRVARARHLVLLSGGDMRLGYRVDGVHGRDPRCTRGIKSWPAHNRRELIAGQRAGADVFFLSPVFATRSHPGARPLGPVRALMLKRGIAQPVIAMGGVGPQHRRWIRSAGFYGWAGIDAWMNPDIND